MERENQDRWRDNHASNDSGLFLSELDVACEEKSSLPDIRLRARSLKFQKLSLKVNNYHISQTEVLYQKLLPWAEQNIQDYSEVNIVATQRCKLSRVCEHTFIHCTCVVVLFL